MAICTNCGAEVSGKFCAKCGAPAPDPGAGTTPPSPESAAPGPAADSSQAGAPPPPGAGGAQTSSGASSAGASAASVPESSQHIAAALSYITPVAVVLLLIDPYKNIRFVRFHAFQSLFYFVAALVIQMIGAFLGPLSLLLTLAVIFVWFYVLIKAYQGEMFEIPVIGPLAAKQASGVA